MHVAALSPRSGLCYEPPIQVEAAQLRWQDLSATAWDEFAQRCGASHRCALDHVRSWRLRYRLRFIELFSVVDGRRHKIGQCAIAWKGRSGRFLDSLQMLPGFDDHWKPAMTAVLRSVGPGRY